MQEVVVKQEALFQGGCEEEGDDALETLPSEYYEKDENQHLKDDCVDGFAGDADLVTGTLSLMAVRLYIFFLGERMEFTEVRDLTAKKYVQNCSSCSLGKSNFLLRFARKLLQILFCVDWQIYFFWFGKI